MGDALGQLGKWVLGSGLVLCVLGLMLWALSWTGWERLPGDVMWRKGSWTFYMPLGLMLLVSVLLTLLLNFLARK